MTETKQSICLVTALSDELNRNRELLKAAFGARAAFIKQSIAKGRDALNSDDVTAMLYAYNDLKENQ
jgi:hypothetical protein